MCPCILMFLTIINLVLFIIILATTACSSTSGLTPHTSISNPSELFWSWEEIDSLSTWLYPLSYYTCPNKVQANCSDSDSGSLRICMIQPCMYQLLLVNYVYCTYITMQLQSWMWYDSCISATLLTSCIYIYICVNGTWKTLCPSLWARDQPRLQ